MIDGKKPSEIYQELRRLNAENLEDELRSRGENWDPNMLIMFVSSKALCDVLDKMDAHYSREINKASSSCDPRMFSDYRDGR